MNVLSWDMFGGIVRHTSLVSLLVLGLYFVSWPIGLAGGDLGR